MPDFHDYSDDTTASGLELNDSLQYNRSFGGQYLSTIVLPQFSEVVNY